MNWFGNATYHQENWLCYLKNLTYYEPGKITVAFWLLSEGVLAMITMADATLVFTLFFKTYLFISR